MSLPKWTTTVTPFSRALAQILFIVLVTGGTYLGYIYGKSLAAKETVLPSENQAVTYNPISWQKYKNDTYNIAIEYPSDVKIINEKVLSSGTKDLQQNWHFLLTNQKDYPERVENDWNGKGLYYIQIQISGSKYYDVPQKGELQITPDNFELLFGGEKSEKGLLRSRPTLKTTDTTYPNRGSINYIIYDDNRIVEITATSDNLDLVPFTTLDKIVTSFQFI